MTDPVVKSLFGKTVHVDAGRETDYDKHVISIKFHDGRPERPHTIDGLFTADDALALAASLVKAANRARGIPEPTPPTFKELWDALPVGVRVKGSSGDPQDWVKLSPASFTLYGTGRTYDVSIWRNRFDKPLPEGWDLTPIEPAE